MKFTQLKAVRNLLHLFFPRVCVACLENTPQQKKQVCLPCEKDLYYTKQHQEKGNEFESHFLGSIPLERGAAMFFYRKDTAIQNILHELKYKGNSDVGLQFGAEYGKTLLDSGFMKNITAIVPIPLHWKKQKWRGYNQAAMFAQGISLATGIPHYPDLLLKLTTNESQTKKGRAARYANVEKTYSLNPKYNLKNELFLLVDDVLTTGATMEACAKKLDLNNNKVCMVTMAIGRM